MLSSWFPVDIVTPDGQLISGPRGQHQSWITIRAHPATPQPAALASNASAPRRAEESPCSKSERHENDLKVPNWAADQNSSESHGCLTFEIVSKLNLRTRLRGSNAPWLVGTKRTVTDDVGCCVSSLLQRSCFSRSRIGRLSGRIKNPPALSRRRANRCRRPLVHMRTSRQLIRPPQRGLLLPATNRICRTFAS